MGVVLYVDDDYWLEGYTDDSGAVAPVQGGWGVREEDADEGRDRVERHRRTARRERRLAVERAFDAIAPQPVPGPVPEPVRREVAAIVAPQLDLGGVEAALARIDGLIAAVWAERHRELTAEAARVEAARREEEAVLMLLMVA